MLDLAKEIARADADEIDRLLKMVMARYAELFPGWELSILSLPKCADRNEQLNGIIQLLQGMKTDS